MDSHQVQEDSDSFNYTTHESMDITEEIFSEDMKESDIPYESLKRSIIQAVKFKFILLGGVSLLFAVLGIVFWNKPGDFKRADGRDEKLILSNIFLMIFFSLNIFMFLSYLIYQISFWGLKNFKRGGYFFYIINELSEHISTGIIMVTILTYVMMKDINVCLKNQYDFDLFIVGGLNIGLIVTFFFGLLKIWMKNMSMTFNYSVYMERVKKCLVEYTVLTLVSMLKGKGENVPHGSEIFRVPSGVRNPKRLMQVDYVLGMLYEKNDKGKLDIPERRILIREFRRIIKKGEIPKTAQVMVQTENFKMKMRKRAEELYRILQSRTPKIRRMAGLSTFFSDQSMFNFILNTLDVKMSYELDKDGLEKILTRNYRERYFLSRNFEQMNAAIERVGLAFKIGIWILGFVLVYAKVYKGSTSPATAVSAIFGTQIISNTLSSNVIGCLIFLFFIHPYDVGDRVFIEIGGIIENLIVSEMNLLSTVFYRWDGTCVYVPNGVLSSKLIANVKRSGVMAESHKIQINSRTNQKKLIKLKESIEEFVKKESDSFTEYIMVNFEQVENCNKLHMKIYMQYKTNWQNYELYLNRKTKFIGFLNRTLNNLGIEYVLPPQKVVIIRKKQLQGREEEEKEKTVEV